jgi:hypothetical protein
MRAIKDLHAKELAMHVLRRFGPNASSQRRLSNLGKWDRKYTGVNAVALYADETTYRIAADFLADCREVEDWGCGSGGFRRFCKTAYIGVDGSRSKFADKIVDLATYRSVPEGILLRHVLEHNAKWSAILQNAVISFRKKLCIVLFTPFANETKEIAYYRDIDVPDIAFRKEDITRWLDGLKWQLQEGLETDSQYGVEHVLLIER